MSDRIQVAAVGGELGVDAGGDEVEGVAVAWDVLIGGIAVDGYQFKVGQF